MTQVVLATEDIRRLEAELLVSLPPGSLMQRAATGLTQVVLCELRARRGRVSGSRILLLVGTGDNGGDALWSGVQLADRGAVVTAVRFGDRRDHRPDEALARAGGRVRQASDALTPLDGFDIVIDGIVGIGGHGPLRGPAAQMVRHLAELAIPVVAMDIPSGVDSHSGAVEGPAVRADVTVVTGALKAGLLLQPGRDHAGRLELIDIGLDLSAPREPTLGLVDADLARRWWPQPGAGDDKYSRGVAGICAGSVQYPGAGVLATGGARRGPIGYVRYVGAAGQHVLDAWPDVVVADDLASSGRVQAWLVGPGIGVDAAGARLVGGVLSQPDVPVVVDADGLTLLSNDEELRDLLRRRVAPTVLTPHEGEFARLGGKPLENRVFAVRDLAAIYGATVLLKGSSTIVAGADGTALINTETSPALASAGTGDVLAGILTALLAAAAAQGKATDFTTVEIAASAAWWHGRAGRLAAAQYARVAAPDLFDHLGAGAIGG